MIVKSSINTFMIYFTGITNQIYIYVINIIQLTKINYINKLKSIQFSIIRISINSLIFKIFTMDNVDPKKNLSIEAQYSCKLLILVFS